MDRTITAICRKCGKASPSAEFRIDVDLKIAVCKACFRIAHPKKVVNKALEPKATKKKPEDWDSIDESLYQRALEKDAQTVTVQEIGKTGKANYKCRRCNYSFKYNLITRSPQRCPYCDGTIPKLRSQ